MFACDGAIDQRFQIVRFQRFEFDDHGSAEQRLDDGEAWVFRGGRDEGDVAVFHTGQQRILLRFGEAVHLVDEQHRFLAFGDETFVRAFEHVTHVLDAGGDRGQFLEDTAGLFGDDIGEGGFADSGRSEQDDGARCDERAFRSGVGESAQWRPLPNTRDCPTTSSMLAGRMRTASGRVTSSGASIAANKSSVMLSTVPQHTQQFEHTFDACVRPNR